MNIQVKGDTLLYVDKNLKYKLRKYLIIYQKIMIESPIVEISNKDDKKYGDRLNKQFPTFWILYVASFRKTIL